MLVNEQYILLGNRTNLHIDEKTRIMLLFEEKCRIYIIIHFLYIFDISKDIFTYLNESMSY